MCLLWPTFPGCVLSLVTYRDNQRGFLRFVFLLRHITDHGAHCLSVKAQYLLRSISMGGIGGGEMDVTCVIHQTKNAKQRSALFKALHARFPSCAPSCSMLRYCMKTPKKLDMSWSAINKVVVLIFGRPSQIFPSQGASRKFPSSCQTVTELMHPPPSTVAPFK